MEHDTLNCEPARRTAARSEYRAPSKSSHLGLRDLLNQIHRSSGRVQQRLSLGDEAPDVPIFWSGDLSVLQAPAVSVVGSRNASQAGLARASRLAKELAQRGVVVVSGLAKGIDTAAHRAAIGAGGSTVAVVGTPLDRCYPAENARLQMEIYSEHLLISQFASGTRTYPSDFPKRNRLMSAVTDATVIVEASDTSGTLHQAAETLRLGRWLFIAQSMIDSPDITWPRKFLRDERCRPLTNIEDIVTALTA